MLRVITLLIRLRRRIRELEKECAQWQAAAGQQMARAEALEDRIERMDR